MDLEKFWGRGQQARMLTGTWNNCTPDLLLFLAGPGLEEPCRGRLPSTSQPLPSLSCLPWGEAVILLSYFPEHRNPHTNESHRKHVQRDITNVFYGGVTVYPHLLMQLPSCCPRPWGWG